MESKNTKQVNKPEKTKPDPDVGLPEWGRGPGTKVRGSERYNVAGGRFTVKAIQTPRHLRKLYRGLPVPFAQPPRGGWV